MNTKNLWNTYTPPTSIIGWKDILQTWDESVSMHKNVEIVLDNLHAASDYTSNYLNLPLTHFLHYLNYEAEAIQWFVYEVIAMRWMWGESRLDFIQSLLNFYPNLVNLEATFCDFIGSPRYSMTLRQFLTEHLSPEEVAFLNMPPPLRTPSIRGEVKTPTYPPAGPTVHSNEGGKKMSLKVFSTFNEVDNVFDRTVQASASNASSSYEEEFEQSQRKKMKRTPFYSSILLRFIAEKDQDKSEDECLHIMKVGDDLYDIQYDIQSIGKKRTQFNMSHLEVHQYISTVLRLMHLDTDPYFSIQFEVPHMPIVLLNPKICSEDRNLLYDALDNTFKNWPLTSETK